MTYPPYSRYLLTNLENLKADTIIIFCGHKAWDKTKDLIDVLPTTICLPPNHQPCDYIWPVNQCYVYLVNTDNHNGNFVDKFILCLYSYGAAEITYIARDIKPIRISKK